MAGKRDRSSRVRLVVSDERDVRVKVGPGDKLDVVRVEMITPDLQKASRVGARLCGYGTNVCLALVETTK